MADDLCSGSWWSAARINSVKAVDFNTSAASAPVLSCSFAPADNRAFRGLTSPTGSITDTSTPMISGFGLSPTPSVNWNQTLLSTERDGTSFQEPLNYFRHEFSIQPESLQGLFEPEAMLQQSIYQHTSSPMTTDSPAKFNTNNQLLFANNAPFWNPMASVTGEAQLGFYPSLQSEQVFTRRSFEQEPSCSSMTTKYSQSNIDTTTTKKKKKSSSSSSSDTSQKKPRTGTRPPLPTFKVRKEKLGDRITALQQLVSPFGKTDTASVLHEAIEYIKFLHDQVNVLSTPYLKNGHPIQHQQSCDELKADADTRKGLQSRGLCLMPLEKIYPVASETTADFWTPSFGGTYR